MFMVLEFAYKSSFKDDGSYEKTIKIKDTKINASEGTLGTKFWACHDIAPPYNCCESSWMKEMMLSSKDLLQFDMESICWKLILFFFPPNWRI